MAIEIERRKRVFLIHLNRPEALNALDVASMRELNERLREFRDDPELLVAVLTGAGERAFCTGADLKKTLPPHTSFAEAYFAPYEQSVDEGLYVRAITISELRINKPLIAAVNGHALGGGMEIALDCDVRIASDNATFGLPEARWASVPRGRRGVQTLARGPPGGGHEDDPHR